MKSSLKNNAESSRWAFVFAILMAALLSIPQVRAANATWIVNANGNWVDSTNWSGGNVPGSTNSTTSTDIATFGGSITGTVVTTIDADRNIGGITFNYDYTGSGNGYSLKNNILLSDGGVIQEISTATPSGSRISRLQNDVFIQGDGGSATIRNNAASGNVRMFLNGVRGTSTTGNTTTLYLDGSNTAPNTFGSRINDGANGGNLAIVKNGTGYWRLTASDSDYSGGTTLNAGRLQYSAGTGSNSTVFGTGTITINGGMLQNTETDAGAKEFTTISNAIVVGGNFQFSTRSNNTTIFSGDVDLTGATRQINVDGTVDSKVVLSGVISNGGLTKVGSQTLILRGDNTFTGAATVNSGTLQLDADSASALGAVASLSVGSGATLLISKSNQVNNLAAVTLSGGTIKRESGVNEVFGNLNLTADSLLDYGSGTSGTLTFGTYTPSSLLTVNNFFAGNQLVFSSDLTSTVTNGTYFSFDNAFNYNWDNGTSTFTITAIPEPSVWLAAIGLIGLMLWPLRRKFSLCGKLAVSGGFGVVRPRIDGHNIHSSSTMKIIRSDFPKYLSRIFALAVFLLAMSIPQVRAADATWIVNANGNWDDSTNWSGGNVPGSTNSTTSTDIATFGGSITGAVTNSIDTDRNIGGITFDYDYTGSGNGYSLKNNILLSDGGVIQEISTATPSGSRISRLMNDVFIQGDGGSATISNNAASGNVRMFLNGVRGTSTTGNTTTLYLDGSNTAPNTFGSRINNGANGGDLALVKNGTGYWRLTASDSDYSGGTTLNAGRLQYSAGTGSNSTVFGTGTITLNGGILQNTETDAGAQEFTTISNAIVVGGNFQFSTRSNNTTIFSGDVDLTGATRQINVDGTADSKVVLSGVISNGGLTKVGSQTLILQGHNIYTGDTTVNGGTLLLGEDGWLTFDIGANGVNTTISGSATIQLDGVFAFDLSGADATFGNSWSIVDTTGGLAANYGATFNVDGFMDNSGIWTKVDGGNLWKFTESTGVLDVSAVPEPGTVALVSLGIGAILLGLRRRMHS